MNLIHILNFISENNLDFPLGIVIGSVAMYIYTDYRDLKRKIETFSSKIKTFFIYLIKNNF